VQKNTWKKQNLNTHIIITSQNIKNHQKIKSINNMKNTIIAVIIFSLLGIWWIAYTDKRDVELMKLCAYTKTHTLYKCN